MSSNERTANINRAQKAHQNGEPIDKFVSKAIYGFANERRKIPLAFHIFYSNFVINPTTTISDRDLNLALLRLESKGEIRRIPGPTEASWESLLTKPAAKKGKPWSAARKLKYGAGVRYGH